ncbi:MAG: methyltransferase [Nitrospiraceae bacterium]|nr:methyltransferase [Nitrospiraceae bacterium]
MDKKMPAKAAELGRIWRAFWTARPLITANNLDVFRHLKTPKTARQVASRIKTDARATAILLDAVAALGLLKKTGDRYSNGEVANAFLVPSSAYYQGDIIRHADNLWRSWSRLDDVVRTGNPAPREKTDIGPFIMGMHNLAVFKATPVMDAAGLDGVKSALDLGGGPGTYTIEMRKRGVADVTIFDRPDAVKIARKNLRKHGVSGVKFLTGDFLTDDIGNGYDLALLSHIMHSNSGEGCLSLLKKVRASLNSKGRAIIHDFQLEENRTAPLSSALFSVNMLVGTPAGRCYTYSEYRSFLRQAGFGGIRKTLLGDTIIVEGRIPEGGD